MEFEEPQELAAIELMRRLVEWDAIPQANKMPLKIMWKWSRAEREQRIKKAQQYFRLQEQWKDARNNGNWAAINIIGYKLCVLVDFFKRINTRVKVNKEE